MTDNSNNMEKQARIDELLAGRTLDDLSPEEMTELGDILLNEPHYDTDEFDRVASALVAGSLLAEEMPSRIREKILQDAPSHLPQAVVIPNQRPFEDTPAMSKRELLAWLMTTACLLIIGIQSWPKTEQVQPAPPTIAELRDDFLKTASDVIQVDWGNGLHPFEGDVTGDVVWSNKQQKGFMKFNNMPANNPSVEQYQLWIIDPERAEQPIDGGVFDVSKTGEVIVAIDAKLKVIAPQAFAITIEKPGGVVVSKQERLPLLAKVEA